MRAMCALLAALGCLVMAQANTVAEAKPRSAASEAETTYGRYLASRLAAVKVFAPTDGHTGTAVVKFKIARSGALVWRRLRKSSGDAHLDALALAIVDRLSPFFPLPDVLDEVVAELPITFRGRKMRRGD